MPTIRHRSWVAAPVDRTFAFFDDPANLSRIMPPPVSIRVSSIDPSPPRAGTLLEFRYGIGPFQRRWIVRLIEREPNERIVDETLDGPLKQFHHEHRFSAARHGTWVEDRIDFHVGPDGPIGAVVDTVAGVVMRLTFVWRAARQRHLLRA